MASINPQPLVSPTVAVTLRRRDSDEDLRNVLSTMPLHQRLNMTYIPLLAKQYCATICGLICDLLATSKVSDEKKTVRQYRKAYADWLRGYHAADMPPQAEECIITLSEWFAEDKLKQHIRLLHFAYSNVLKREYGGKMQSNTDDLFAYVLATRALANVTLDFDEQNKQLINSIVGSPCVRSNMRDFTRTIRDFCTTLLAHFFGHDINPVNDHIKLGIQTLHNDLRAYDTSEMLSQFWARKARAEAHHDCPADRCGNCPGFTTCKTLKSTRKDF